MPAVLKQVSGTLGENQKWIEDIHEQVMGNTRLMTVALNILLVMAEQQGLDADTVAKLIKANGEDAAENFLEHFADGDAGKEG